MNNLDTLIRSLQAFLDNHKQVKRFRFDFLDQLDSFAQLNEEYPLVFANPETSISISNNNGYIGTEFSIKISVLDRINNDRSNVFTVLNESNNIINDIIIWFKNSKIPLIENDFIIEDINDEYSHRLIGKSIILSFLVDAQTDCVYPVYECEDGKFILKNTLDEIKEFRIPSGSEVSNILSDSTLNLSIYDRNNNYLGEYDFDIPAFHNSVETVNLLLNSEINIQNSNNTFNQDIDDDFILPDTTIKIKLKDSNDTFMREIEYNIPSSISEEKELSINDSILNLTIKNLDGNIVSVEQFTIKAESIENDSISLSIRNDIEIKNSDNSYIVDIDDDFILPDTKFTIKLKNSIGDSKDETFIKPSVGEYTEEIELDDIKIGLYIDDDKIDDIYIIYNFS